MRQPAWRFFADSSGNVAIISALVALPLFGGMGLAVDYSAAISERTRMKDAANAAVLGGVSRYGSRFGQLSSTDKADLISQVKGHFYANSRIRDATVVVSIDEPNASLSADVSHRYMAMFPFFGDTYPLAVRATAVVGAPTSTYCMLALSKVASGALKFGGHANFKAPDCSVHSNSVSSSALMQSGGVTVRAKDFCAVGGASGKFSPAAQTKCTGVSDPFASIAMPAKTGTCSSGVNGAFGSGNYTLSPGRYCGGWKLASSANVSLNPGVYVFSGGPLAISNTSRIAGKDVTIIFVDDHSYLDMSGGADIEISAPKTGTYAGIAIARRADTTPSKPMKITGGGTVNIVGSVYAPSQNVVITGNGQIGIGSSQFAIVADTIEFTGSSTIDLNMTVNSDFKTAGYSDKTLAVGTTPRLTE